MAVDTGMNTGVNVGVDASAAREGARQFVESMRTMGVAAETTIDRIKRTIGSLKDSLFSLQGILAQVSLAMEFKSIVETNIEFARWHVMLEAVAGSAQKGQAEFQWLNEEVDTLGLRLNIAAEQFTQFASASKDTALQGEGARKVFHALSEELTVMHAGPEQVQRAFMQMREMMSIGNITMQHMKYLATSIPDIMALAAKGLGKSQEEFHRMMQKGLKADVFFPAVAKAMDEQYSAAALKAADMTQALINRIYNAKMRLEQMVSEGGFGKGFDNALRHIRDVLESDAIKQAAVTLGNVLGHVLSILTDGFMFVARHADLFAIAITALIGIKTFVWFNNLISDVDFAIERFKKLTRAVAESEAVLAGADALRGLAGGKARPRSLGAAAASEVPAVVRETGAEAIEGMTAVELAEITSRGKGVNIGGVSPNVEALRMEKAAAEATFAAEAMGAEVATEAVTNLGNANGRLAYFGRSAELAAKANNKEAFNARTLFDNLGAAEGVAAEQGELFALEQTAVAAATKTATTEVVAFEGAVVTAEAVTATAAVKAGLLARGWAAIVAAGETAIAVMSGLLAGMTTFEIAATGVGAVLLVAAGAMYYFRDSIIEAKGTSAREGTIIRVIWGDIADGIADKWDMAVMKVKFLLAELQDKMKTTGKVIRAIVNDLEPIWRPILDEWKNGFQEFDDWLQDTWLGRARKKLDDYEKSVMERANWQDDPNFEHHATTTMGLHPFKGIGSFKGKSGAEDDKKNRYQDLIAKINDEIKTVKAEDEVYKKFTGTIENTKFAVEMLAATHKAYAEWLQLPKDDRTIEHLNTLIAKNRELARVKDQMAQHKFVQEDIKEQMMAIQAQDLMTAAMYHGADAVMVATERLKEYEKIKKNNITDPAAIEAEQKATDARIASNRRAAVGTFFDQSVEPLLSHTVKEEEDYKTQLGYIHALRDAKIISAKEAAVIQEQLDNAREDRDNRYLMSTRDGLNGLIVAQREMARQMKDHAAQMREIYTRNMQALQNMLDDFFVSGKMNIDNFLKGLQKDIVHQLTGDLIMKPLNEAMGKLFSTIDNGGENTAGGGFLGGILGKVFGKGSGTQPWDEHIPGGVPSLGKRVDMTAGIVNLRAMEFQGGSLKSDVIDLIKPAADKMKDGAKEATDVWLAGGQEVENRFGNAADMLSQVLQSMNVSNGKGGWTDLIGKGIGVLMGGGSDSGGFSLGEGADNVMSEDPGVPMAAGGIMTRYGKLTLRRYAGGGIAQANNPQMSIFGEGDMNEAYVPLPDGRSIPVNMRGTARGGQRHFHMENHFHFPNASVDAFRKSRDQIAADMAVVQQHAMSRIN